MIIPVQCEYLALEGLSQLTQTIARVRSAYHPGLTVRGVVMTMFDGRANLANQVVAEVRSHFPGRVFASHHPAQRAPGGSALPRPADFYLRSLFAGRPSLSRAGRRNPGGEMAVPLPAPSAAAPSSHRDGVDHASQETRSRPRPGCAVCRWSRTAGGDRSEVAVALVRRNPRQPRTGMAEIELDGAGRVDQGAWRAAAAGRDAPARCRANSP